jgi:hypothetical protein
LGSSPLISPKGKRVSKALFQDVCVPSLLRPLLGPQLRRTTKAGRTKHPWLLQRPAARAVRAPASGWAHLGPAALPASGLPSRPPGSKLLSDPCKLCRAVATAAGSWAVPSPSVARLPRAPVRSERPASPAPRPSELSARWLPRDTRVRAPTLHARSSGRWARSGGRALCSRPNGTLSGKEQPRAQAPETWKRNNYRQDKSTPALPSRPTLGRPQQH